MVKSKPRIPDRAARRRHRFDNKQQAHHRHLLKLASFSSPSSPSSSTAQPPPNSTKTTTSSTTTTTATQKSPATPSSLSIRRKIRNFMKRSKPRTKSPSSPFCSPLSQSQSRSLSLSPSLSCSSSSPRNISLSPLTFSSPELSPSPPKLPPLPPQPSPELIRRCISDPVTLNHLSGDIHNFTLKSPSSSSSRPVSRNLMRQLPPLPPSSSSSPSNLRRTFSEPVSSLSPTHKDENVKKMKKEETVAVEKLSGEWIVVKFNCECGKDGHFLVNAADKKYFKLT